MTAKMSKNSKNLFNISPITSLISASTSIYRMFIYRVVHKNGLQENKICLWKGDKFR